LLFWTKLVKGIYSIFPSSVNMVSIFSVDGVREVKEEYWQLLDIRNFRDKYQQLIKVYKISFIVLSYLLACSSS